MSRAQKIWEAFKGELIVEPTDDMREALATAIRKIIYEFEQYVENDTYEELFMSSNDLSNLADELERLE